MPTHPAEWAAGERQDADALPRQPWAGANGPPRYTFAPGRGVIVPNDLACRHVPPPESDRDLDAFWLPPKPPRLPDHPDAPALPLWAWLLLLGLGAVGTAVALWLEQAGLWRWAVERMGSW